MQKRCGRGRQPLGTLGALTRSPPLRVTLSLSMSELVERASGQANDLLPAVGGLLAGAIPGAWLFRSGSELAARIQVSDCGSA